MCPVNSVTHVPGPYPLGSPHRGTASVRGVGYAPELRQLDRDSDFIADLPDFSATAAQAEVITVATQRDFLIYPADTAHLPGSRRFVFSQVPHQGLVIEEEVIRWVVGTICEPKITP